MEHLGKRIWEWKIHWTVVSPNVTWNPLQVPCKSVTLWKERSYFHLSSKEDYLKFETGSFKRQYRMTAQRFSTLCTYL